jgi:Fur family transcriptional regulator, ferric uptake regulator
MLNTRSMENKIWRDKFKSCGYRPTVGRNAIFDLFSRTKGHLSANDIYVKLHRQYPVIGLTTIYRTLDVASNLGMLYKLDFGDGQVRYELAEAPGKTRHHHHLICTSCNAIVDYTDYLDEEIKLLRKTEKGLAKKYGFKITDHVVQFYGLCDTCLQERKDNA